jgi:predicted methyltransferase
MTSAVTFAQHGQDQRRPADIKEYLEQLDRPERDQDQKPSQVVDALALKPGMAVADLGSGSGYFTRRFVEAVTETGMVYAIDVEQEMLTYTKESLVHLHIPFTAEFILARPDSPKLPPDSVNLIFGRVAIIDFYHDERSGNLGFPKHHLVQRETVVEEMTKAGYKLLREHGFLPRQYFLEFVPST